MTEKEFEEIFNREHRPLVNFAKSIIGELYAEDAVAQAFCGLWEYGDCENPKAFLIRSIKNKCLNDLKHNKIISSVHKKMFYETDLSEDYIEARMTKSQLLQRIAAEIEKLTPDRKKIIKAYWLGFDTDEIAGMFKISVDTVRVQWKRFVDDFGKDIRRRRFIEYNGETLSLKEWSERLSIPCCTIRKRLERELPLEQIFEKKAPNEKVAKRVSMFITFNGKTQTVKQWANELSMDYFLIRRRFQQRLPPEQILEKKDRRIKQS